MQDEEFMQMLSETDFHLDPLGRIVIDNPDILQAINGALNPSKVDDLLFNGGCSNSGCA